MAKTKTSQKTSLEYDVYKRMSEHTTIPITKSEEVIIGTAVRLTKSILDERVASLRRTIKELSKKESEYTKHAVKIVKDSYKERVVLLREEVLDNFETILFYPIYNSEGYIQVFNFQRKKLFEKLDELFPEVRLGGEKE